MPAHKAKCASSGPRVDHSALWETLGMCFREDAAKTIQYRYRYWIQQKHKGGAKYPPELGQGVSINQ